LVFNGLKTIVIIQEISTAEYGFSRRKNPQSNKKKPKVPVFLCVFLLIPAWLLVVMPTKTAV